MMNNELSYKRIFEENPTPLALSDPITGIFFEVNQAFLDLYEYQRDEVIGRSSLDLNIYADPDNRNKIVYEWNALTHPWDKEITVQTKTGKKITGLFWVKRIPWAGKEALLIGMNDITYLKEIETSLSSKNQCIQEIISNVNEGIVVYDSHLNYRVWNRFMEDLTGVSQEEIIGKPILNFLPLLKGDNLIPLARRALQGVTSTSDDVWYQIPQSGKSGWVSIIYSPFRQSDGTINGVIASVRDISDRKRAEDEIRSHKGLLRSIIDTVPVSIICFDEKGTILLANKHFGISFGVSSEVIEGYTYQDLSYETRFEQHLSFINKAISGREVPFDEVIEPVNTGKLKRYLRGRYSPLRGSDGMIEGVVAVIIDITDLKVAQNAIEQINSKLNLLSSITRHDILNSLTGVLGYLSYAEEEQDPELLQKYIKKAYQIALLIQEQIEFTRDYQDLGVKEPLWQQVRTVFVSALRNLKMQDITVNLKLDDLSVFADPLLERVIYNLVDNALRYGEKVTEISSFWFEEETQAVWIIQDNGVGVPDDMKERIFRKGVGNNTGLGLFLTGEILDITGLTIKETGTPGEGACFEISIPKWAWKKPGEQNSTP